LTGADLPVGIHSFGQRPAIVGNTSGRVELGLQLLENPLSVSLGAGSAHDSVAFAAGLTRKLDHHRPSAVVGLEDRALLGRSAGGH
jgi:hypothetical protein